jgi:predicted homoserine dehydrogenase-like protein
MSLRERLQDREKKLGVIRVGLVGAGQMGTGLISQVEKMAGMRVMATADVVPNRAVEAYKESDVPAGDVVALDENPQKASELIMGGKRIATNNADFLVSIGALDVIVECTGIPEIGARVCYAAIQAGKSVVNMNVETDATIGYILAKKAKEKNVTYTLIAGDEPGSIKEMVDFAETLGFEVAAVGKGKNNVLDRTANPETVAQKAKAQMMSPKMLASFMDGTKTMVEMTSIGNGLGFAPEVLGAYGPTCDVKDLPNTFVPKSAGGIFNAKGAVDYAVGSVAPGVFVIITTDQPKIIRDLRYLRLSANQSHNYWALYRPYHLCNLEAPISIVRVALDNEVTLATYRRPVAETAAFAKKDLIPGDKIDALGGFAVYGLIDRADHSQKEEMLPLGLAVGGVMKKAVKAGDPIRYSDVDLIEDQVIVKLRREQDKLFS